MEHIEEIALYQNLGVRKRKRSVGCIFIANRE